MPDYAKIAEALGQTWPARLAKGAWSGLTLPGDVYQGNVSMMGDDGHTNPAVIDRTAELAGLMTMGSAGAIPEGAVGSGMARMRMIDNADQLRELANARRTMGWATGKSAPGHDFKRPDAAKGSWERLVAETNAKWAADKERAVNGYHEAAPAAVPPPTASPYMTKADWEFIAKNGGLAVPGLIGLGAAFNQRDDM